MEESVQFRFSWWVKALAVFMLVVSIFSGAFNIIYALQNSQYIMIFLGLMNLLVAMIAIYGIIYSTTKIYVNQIEIKLITLRGAYEMQWDEVKLTEKRNASFFLWDDTKAISYNIKLPGINKMQFIQYVDQIIDQRSIKTGRFDSIAHNEQQEMLKNAKVSKKE